jgi:hypothetical protein
LDKDAKQTLRGLQNDLVMVSVDKAASNIGFICKRFYCEQMRTELESTNAYQKVTDKDSDEIIAAHKQFLDPLFSFDMESLPIIYWTPKFHKNPFGARYIVAAVGCTSSRLSKFLSNMLTHVLRTLRELDNTRIAKTGVRRFFVVDTYEELSTFLQKWRRDPDTSESGLQCGDFSTMYTAIPHEDLVKALDVVTKEAFCAAGVELGVGNTEHGVLLECSKGDCKWIKGTASSHSRTTHRVTQADLVELIRWLVENTYVFNKGGALYRQLIGLPMGTNCAPALANLYLYYYESMYVAWVEREKSRKDAQLFHMTFRYIYI